MTTNSQPLGGSAASLWAYLEGEDEAEYYLGPGSHMGEVWGPGSERLGLDGWITKTQYTHLHHGKSLNGREQLIPTQNGKHVALINVDFTAPKGVSVFAEVVATDEQR